jgi:small subunit ribosomal protein S14
MRKRYLVQKDVKIRQEFLKKETQRRLLKAVVYQVDLPASVRVEAHRKLANMKKTSCYVRMKNRCTLTARSGSVLRHFALSRISFREAASHGYLTGVKKAN